MSNRCSLFGFFGWFIQGVLFFTSGSPLLWKWWHEKPRRAFITLVLDSSKQVGGNIGAHFINLALSALFSKNIKPVDSCGVSRVQHTRSRAVRTLLERVRGREGEREVKRVCLGLFCFSVFKSLLIILSFLFVFISMHVCLFVCLWL